MRKTYFSIITICYNVENEIEATLKSVYDQKYSNYEYIVIDGASTDNTLAIVEKYKELFSESKIRMIFISEKDKGIADAFNKGIKLASGDFIGLINAGDRLMPNSLNIINDFLEEDDEIIYGKTLFIDEKHHLEYLRPIPENLDLSKMKYNGLVFTHQSAFVKKTVYDKFGLYDTNYKIIMDWDLFLVFYNNGVRFRYCDQVLVAMLAGGISTLGTTRMLKEEIQLSKKFGGNSTIKIFLKWFIKYNVIRIIKDIVKTLFPSLWYTLLGKERLVK